MNSQRHKIETPELNIAWSHYQLLLNLRLKYSQFFILLSTFLAGGFLTIFQESTSIPPHFRVGIGVLLILFSAVFAGIDWRNNKCRNHVKKIIKEIEVGAGYPEYLKLSRMLDTGGLKHFKTYILSCVIYLIFVAIGIIFIIISI